MVEIDKDVLMFLIDRAITAAPNAGIMYLFYSVRQSNFQSGRNTSPPGGSPLGSITSADPNALAGLSQNLGVGTPEVWALMNQIAKTTGADFASIYNALKGL